MATRGYAVYLDILAALPCGAATAAAASGVTEARAASLLRFLHRLGMAALVQRERLAPRRFSVVYDIARPGLESLPPLRDRRLKDAPPVSLITLAAVWRELAEPCDSGSLAAETGMCRRNVMSLLRMMRERKLIRVAMWTRTRSVYVANYTRTPGPNVKRPASMDRRTVRNLSAARSRARARNASVFTWAAAA